MSDIPPETPVEPARKSLLSRVSIVWVIPVAALLIALGVAWNSYADRGPLLELAFDSAAGITAGETELRYRDVSVGVVESVSFTESLRRVLVSVRLDKEVAPYVDSDAKFWVVRPEVSAQGVTGLDTVLSGIFIQGIWNEEPGGFVARHDASTEAPLNRRGQAGLTLRLRAAGSAGLTERAPILYRGIEVGRIGKAEVSADGSTVEAEAIVFAPHDRLVSSATRFWDASGFSLSIGPGGAAVDFSSLSSLVSGAITFRNVVSGGEPTAPGTLFRVYADESAAQSSLFGEGAGGGEVLLLTAIFKENVAGLTVGAPVDLGGLRIGQVRALSGVVDPARFGDDRARLAATLAIRPGQLGLPETAQATDALDYLTQRVRDGLRARLVTASVLTGGLKVQLTQVPEAAPATLQREAEPNPVIPTVESDITDVTATAEGLYNRVNALPIEEVMQSAINALDNISRLTGSEDTRAVPGEVRALLADTRGIVGGEAAQALPRRLSAVVAEIETLVARINAQDTAGRLTAALDAAAKAAESVDAATAGVPALVDRLNALAAKAEALPLGDLAERIAALLDSADRLIDTDQARELPADLSAALEELRAVLAELREGGAVENANATLASTRQAADDISVAAADLPDVLRRAEAALDQAEATMRGYDASRGVGREIQSAVREVERAAAAVSSLVRSLERNPNSLLFGR